MRTATSTPLDSVRGQIESVRLLKDGWGSANVRTGTGDGHVVKVMGTVLGFEPGATVEARGRWDEHPQFGRQFKAATIEIVIPQDAGGAIAWLAATLPGLGRKRAAELVERFGLPPALWNVIENEHERLAEVPGITIDGALRIHEAHERAKGDRDDAVTLRGWGLTEWQIKAVREQWKEKAVAELRRDPYQLAEHVRGFGFKRADEVALQMDAAMRYSPSRIRAAICHLLVQAEGDGHCFIPGGKIVAFAAKLLGFEATREGDIARELAILEQCKRVVRDGTRVYRPETYGAEAAFADAVVTLLAWTSGAVELAALPPEAQPAPQSAAFDDGQPIPDDDDAWTDFGRGAA